MIKFQKGLLTATSSVTHLYLLWISVEAPDVRKDIVLPSVEMKSSQPRIKKLIQTGDSVLAVLFETNTMGLYFLNNNPLTSDQPSFMHGFTIDLKGIVTESVHLAPRINGLVFLCGDAEGNIYYRNISAPNAVTIRDMPLVVEQDPDWVSGHPDR